MRSKTSILAFGRPNNMFLRKFESKVLRDKCSQDCRNVTKVCLFAICCLRHLFRHRGSQKTCFLENLNRKFWVTTFHNFVETLRNLVYSQYAFLDIYLGDGGVK